MWGKASSRTSSGSPSRSSSSTKFWYDDQSANVANPIGDFSKSGNQKGRKKDSWGKKCATDKAAKRHRNRERVAKELLSTEESYVKQLDIICEKFQKPMYLASKSRNPILPLDEVKALFSDIAVMRDLNHKFLSDLRSKMQNYTINTHIGDTLLQFIPYLRMYRSYVEKSETEKVRGIMRRLDHKKKSTFKKFCEQVSEKNGCLPLSALLITPVQRIPRYRLLVAEYIKHTHETHPDYKKLGEVLNKIKETANFVNESVRLKHSKTKIIEKMKLFSKDPGFVAPHRLYRMDGLLTKKLKGAEDRIYHFFLFNDVLAYAHGKFSATNPNGSYVLHIKIPVDGKFQVKDVTGSDHEPNSFQILNSIKSIQVFAKDSKEKSEWMQELNDVAKEWLLDKGNGERKRQMAVPDLAKRKTCARQFLPNGKRCNSTFGLFKKRRYCYTCGITCCDSCSPYKVYINAGDAEKFRVCTRCIRPLMEIEQNMVLYGQNQLPKLAPKDLSSPPRACTTAAK